MDGTGNTLNIYNTSVWCAVYKRSNRSIDLNHQNLTEPTLLLLLLLQLCPTLCDSIDGSPPGSPVPGILQARTLEWVAISFSNA